MRSAVIHGELTADEQRIVLLATGQDNEDMMAAAGQLRLMTPLLERSDPPGGLTLPASWPAVVQLAHTFGEHWRPRPRLREWIIREVIRRTTTGSAGPGSAGPGGLAAEVPDGLVPRPYQVEGAKMIAAAGSVLLTDQPGTGKTITAILGLRERDREHRVRPVVVVCPASVVDHWVATWHTWAPDWTVSAWRGTPAQRRVLAGTADVYVASYDTARRDAGPTAPGTASPLIELAPAAVVIDESHYVANPHAARTQAVRRLARLAGTVVALSGTPITHNAADLWPTLAALSPRAWPSRERWVRRYCLTVPGDYREQVLGLDPAYEPEFRQALAGAHRRVAKTDVLAQLPPKVHSRRTVDLPPRYRRAYDAMEADMLAELPDGGELAAMSVLAQLTRLSQLASAAADVTVTKERDEEGCEHLHQHVRLRRPSWKVDALLEVLAERPGQPVVAFAPSRQLIQLAGKAAGEAGYRVGYVVGGQTPRQRTATVERFQAGELDVLCATTSAGGVGLTLTAAGTVVFLQRPWSLVEAVQAEDRCHRIGSEHHGRIEVIDILARDTIDTRIRGVLREKAGQLADLLQDRRILTQVLGGGRPLRAVAA